jgi:predicted nucleic acid-binding protein
MTVVIADTSPLNYLLLIGEVAVLPALYRQVAIPREVMTELSDAAAPPSVSSWVLTPPNWLIVRSTGAVHEDPTLQQLDPSERAAILLAQEEPDVLLSIDETAGRTEATRRGIPNTGTLGVLRVAAIRQLLDLPIALKRLTETNFRISHRLVPSYSPKTSNADSAGGNRQLFAQAATTYGIFMPHEKPIQFT